MVLRGSNTSQRHGCCNVALVAGAMTHDEVSRLNGINSLVFAVPWAIFDVNVDVNKRNRPSCNDSFQRKHTFKDIVEVYAFLHTMADYDDDH